MEGVLLSSMHAGGKGSPGECGVTTTYDLVRATLLVTVSQCAQSVLALDTLTRCNSGAGCREIWPQLARSVVLRVGVSNEGTEGGPRS